MWPTSSKYGSSLLYLRARNIGRYSPRWTAPSTLISGPPAYSSTITLARYGPGSTRLADSAVSNAASSSASSAAKTTPMLAPMARGLSTTG